MASSRSLAAKIVERSDESEILIFIGTLTNLNCNLKSFHSERVIHIKPTSHKYHGPV